MNHKAIFVLILGLSLVACDMEKFYEQFVGNNWNSVDGWGYYNSYKGDNVFFTCGTEKIFGGRGIFGARSAITKSFKLPPHHTAQVKFQFWKMDSWDNEKFQVYIDDKLVFDKNYQVAQGDNICNNVNGWNTLKEDVDVKISHINPTLIVVLTSTLDEHADNESFGFKNFQLFIDKCPINCNACINNNKETCLMWDIVISFWTKDDVLGNEGWTVDGGKDAGYTCAGIQMYGGFNNFGRGAKISKKIELPPHYRLKIKVTYFKIDSWDNHDAWIAVEGEKIWKRPFAYNEIYKLCGVGEYSWKSIFVGVDAEIAHTKGVANIMISSDLDETPDNESFGVRDFFLYIAKCSKSCATCSGPTDQDCTKCNDNWIIKEGKCQPLVDFILLEQSFLERKFAGLSGWILENAFQNKQLSECDGYTLVGGFSVFGNKAIARKSWVVPKHRRMRIMVQFWKIDSWDGEFLFIDVDGSRIWQKMLSFASGGQQLCGRQDSNWNELILDVDEIFFHDQPQVNVIFSSTLDEAADNESWGFREFKIFYEAQAECAIFFSECDYQGASFEFCGESSNFRRDNVPLTIRSIKIPPQGRITLYQNNDFDGKTVTYTQSQPCIKAFQFSFLQINYQVEPTWTQME